MERLDGFVEREQSFTSTASHELRTPLAVMRGAVELLETQAADRPGAAKALARIQRAVREMTEFTDALLALSREQRAATDAACDVKAVLARIVEDQRSVAPDKRIVLEIEAGDALRVSAPESMVAMTIGNLVRNAVQHGDRRGSALSGARPGIDREQFRDAACGRPGERVAALHDASGRPRDGPLPRAAHL